jgi:hypothetical protein
MEMRLQFIELNLTIYRHGVAYDVEITLVEIDDLLTTWIQHICVFDVPLGGHCPVETLCARRDFMDRQVR